MSVTIHEILTTSPLDLKWTRLGMEFEPFPLAGRHLRRPLEGNSQITILIWSATALVLGPTFEHQPRNTGVIRRAVFTLPGGIHNVGHHPRDPHHQRVDQIEDEI